MKKTMTTPDASSTPHGSWLTGTPWREMRLHANIDPGKGLRIMNTGYHGNGGNPVYWMLTPENDAAFLLPISHSDTTLLPVGGRRLAISYLWWAGNRWVQVRCDDPRLEDVFLRFCESILVDLDSGTGTVEAITTALERYRQLFLGAEQVVDRDRLAGLFAELVVLGLFLDKGVHAVNAWRGPYGETHDFIFPEEHVEVKSLSISGERCVRISSIYQLSPPENKPLCLITVPLAPGNRTIAEQYDSVRKLTCLEETGLLEEAMRAAGCPDPYEHAWNTRGFETGTPEAWEVREGFPRLVPDMIDGGLPHGVSNVSYKLSLGTCDAFNVSVDSVLQSVIIQQGQ